MKHFANFYASGELSVPEIDSSIWKLKFATNLKWLDVTIAPVSSFHFLKNLTNLTVIIIDSCANIKDCEIFFLGNCLNLNSYTLGSPKSQHKDIIHAIPPQLQAFECSGIYFNEMKVRNIFCYMLNCGLYLCYIIIHFSVDTSIFNVSVQHIAIFFHIVALFDGAVNDAKCAIFFLILSLLFMIPH